MDAESVDLHLRVPIPTDLVMALMHPCRRGGELDELDADGWGKWQRGEFHTGRRV